jgi:hypothetical protein
VWNSQHFKPEAERMQDADLLGPEDLDLPERPLRDDEAISKLYLASTAVDIGWTIGAKTPRDLRLARKKAPF